MIFLDRRKVKEWDLRKQKKELTKIRAKYEDPRRWSWDKKDLEESKKRDLEKERAAESIIKILKKRQLYHK